MVVVGGKLIGARELASSMRYYPKIYLAVMSDWMRDERARFLGGPNSKGVRKRGFRDILQSKPKKGRGKGWFSQVTGLFKGYMPKVSKMDNLRVAMGILGTSRHQLRRAMELLETGGTISSSKMMPVPIYKNLAKIGYTGPWSMGNVHSGMKSKAFSKYVNAERLTMIQSSDAKLYFDKKARLKGGKFPKSGLLFVGVHSVKISKIFIGRYDFYGRFDKMTPKFIARGQKAVDRASRKVAKKYY